MNFRNQFLPVLLSIFCAGGLHLSSITTSAQSTDTAANISERAFVAANTSLWQVIAAVEKKNGVESAVREFVNSQALLNTVDAAKSGTLPKINSKNWLFPYFQKVTASSSKNPHELFYANLESVIAKAKQGSSVDATKFLIDFAEGLHANAMSFKVADIPELAILSDPQRGIIADPAANKFIADIVPQLFRNLDTQDQLEIIGALFQAPKILSEGEVLFHVFDHSPASLINFFQLHGQKIQDPAIRREFVRIQNEIHAIDPAHVKSSIENSLARWSVQLDFFDPRPLRAGKVAQIHRGEISLKGRKIAVAFKVRRPDYMEKNQRAFAILKQIPMDSLLEETVRVLEHMTYREGNLLVEAAGIRHGLGYEAANTHVKSVRLAGNLASENLIVMEFVEGTPVKEVNASSVGEVANTLRLLFEGYTTWLQRAFYQDGFLHGDPHAGNLLVSKDSRHLIFLDYGISESLHESDQKGLVKLGKAVIDNNSSAALSAIEALLLEPGSKALPPKIKDHLYQAFQSSSGRSQLTISQSLNTSITVLRAATDSGLKLNERLLSFHRGFQNFEQAVKYLYERLLEMDPSAARRIQNFDSVTQSIVVKGEVGNLIDGMFSAFSFFARPEPTRGRSTFHDDISSYTNTCSTTLGGKGD